MTDLEYEERYGERVLSDKETEQEYLTHEEYKEKLRDEFRELIKGKIEEIKYCRFDDDYNEIYEEFEEYNIERIELEHYGVMIRRIQNG